MAIDGERQRATKAEVAQQAAPHRIVDVEIGVKRELATRAGAPQSHIEVAAIFALPQECVIVEAQITGLKITFAGGGFGRDDLAVGERQDNLVDIGQLTPCRIHTIIIRISFENISQCRGFGFQNPRVESWQFRVVIPIHGIHFVVEGGPIMHSRFLYKSGKYFLVGIFRVELLQIMGGTIDEQRVRPGEGGQEQRVRLRPAIADRRLVEHFEARRLAFWQQLHRQSRGRQFGVLCHVLEPIAEILGGKGMTVRPFHSLAQMQGKDAALLDIDRFEDVGLDLERRRIADQPRIAVDDHHAGILGGRHQHAQLPPGFPVASTTAGSLGTRSSTLGKVPLATAC